MPVFMVERRFADRLEADAEMAAAVNAVNDEEGVRWLYSFLSADRRKTFCLYEAPDMTAVRRAAVRAGLPADAIMELSGQLASTGEFSPL